MEPQRSGRSQPLNARQYSEPAEEWFGLSGELSGQDDCGQRSLSMHSSSPAVELVGHTGAVVAGMSVALYRQTAI